MKEVYLILLVVICVATAISIVDSDWEDFKTKYNKQYSADEEVERRRIFYSRKFMIEEHNKRFREGNVTFEMGINKFADMLLEEVSIERGISEKADIFASSKTNLVFEAVEGAAFPDSVDWRDKGYVTPVPDQGNCVSSWAFSATGALEGQWFALTGKLINFSEQNLIDCDDYSAQCYGGFSLGALDYIQEFGIESEESYPYVAKNQPCRYDPKKVEGRISGYVRTPYGRENDLMAASATIGPISVGFDANHDTFIYYKGGVYYEKYCNKIRHNHYALLVGYGSDNGEDYWLVKNSWGTDWGEEGYVRMARNKKDQCAIANYAFYPLI